MNMYMYVCAYTVCLLVAFDGNDATSTPNLKSQLFLQPRFNLNSNAKHTCTQCSNFKEEGEQASESESERAEREHSEHKQRA